MGVQRVYIKDYEVNFDYKLSASSNALPCKDIIQDHLVHILNHGKIRRRYVSHIRIISLFINSIIENYHIEGMNKFLNIISDDLKISQLFNSDIASSLDEVSQINT